MPKFLKSRWFLALAAILLIVAGLLALANSLLSNRCEREIISRSPSADGQLVALAVVTNCGATTDYNTSIYLVRSGAESYSEDDDVFSVKGYNKVEIVWDDVWHGRNVLTIAHQPPARIFRQATFWRGDEIKYEQKPR